MHGFCITINNFSEEEKQRVHDIIMNECDYGIAEIEHSLEHTPEEEHEFNLTPHIQAYLHFKNAKRLTTISSALRRAHIEPAKADWKLNFIYCSKENKIFAIKGHTIEEAKRKKDKAHLIEIIADAKILSPKEFEEKHPEEWYRNRERVMRTMIESAAQKAKPWSGMLHNKNIWIWGKPGVGKSKWACQLFPLENTFKKNFNKWWDGYNLLDTKCVIIEDYPCIPAGNALCQHIKIWGDRYQFTGECKGSHIYVDPGRFFLIITSNYPIEACFQNPDDIEAIKRRFEEIEMTEENRFTIGATVLNQDILSK